MEDLGTDLQVGGTSPAIRAQRVQYFNGATRGDDSVITLSSGFLPRQMSIHQDSTCPRARKKHGGVCVCVRTKKFSENDRGRGSIFHQEECPRVLGLMPRECYLMDGFAPISFAVYRRLIYELVRG